MKNKKKLLTLTLMGVLSALTLASCGGNEAEESSQGGNPNSSNSNGETSEFEQVDVVDAVLPRDDPSSEVTIKFWSCLGHEKSTNLGKIMDDFNKKYQGKYKVIEEKIAGTYDGLSDAIKQKLASNEIPALTMGYPDNFSVYMGQRIEHSAILRLDNFIKDADFGYSEDDIKDFVPAFYEEGSDYQFKGQWSMPMYKSTEIMYYNMNYFFGDNPANSKKFASNSEYEALRQPASASSSTDEQLNALKTWLQAHDGYVYDVPVTWEQMVSVSKKMKEDLKKEGVTNEFYPVGYDSDSNLLISQFAMRGIEYTTNENISKPKDHIKFNNPEAKAFVSDVVKLYQDGLFITKGLLGGKYTNDYFTAKQSAMSIGSTGGSSYNVSSNFRVGLAAVPYPEGKTPKYIQQGPSICFFNNDNPYIHKGAWLFYKELANPVNNAKLAMQNSYDPVRVSSFETNEYKEWIAQKDTDLKYAIPAATASLRDKYMTSAVFLGSEKARDEVGQILTYIIAQGKSVDKAVQDAYNNTVKATKPTY